MPKRIIGATLLLTVCVASCRTWRPVQGIPDLVPEPIRVELVTGEQIKLMGGRVEDDTLLGRLAGEGTLVRISLSQIEKIQARRISGGRTVLFVVGVIVGVMVGIFIDIDRNYGR